MEFKIERATLLQGLYLAQGISDRKSTMPILANVLLRTDGKDRLLLAATDLNVTVTAELPCKVEKEGGLTVGAKHLHDIVKSLPGEALSLTRTENNYADLKAGKVAADFNFSADDASYSKASVMAQFQSMAQTYYGRTLRRQPLDGDRTFTDPPLGRLMVNWNGG